MNAAEFLATFLLASLLALCIVMLVMFYRDLWRSWKEWR